MVADDADTRRVGRPHRETRPRHAVDLVDVRAQHAVEIEMIALREEPDVELAQQRTEAVRIVDGARPAFRLDAQAIATRQLVDVGFEEAGPSDALGLG